MSQAEEDTEEDLYVFKAPSEDKLTEDHDETGAIIGALAACVIISCVLFFLWKLLQKKKQEMKELHKGNEDFVVQTDENASPYNKESQSVNNLDINPLPNKKLLTWNQFQLPNSTIEEEKDFDTLQRNDVEEIILPSLSPIPSCTASQHDHEELTSFDTGYNSEICRAFRRYDTLKRRQKIKTDELYLEHSDDIIRSLKQKRHLISVERSNRVKNIQSASEILKSCLEIIRNVKNLISLRSPDQIETYKMLKQLRLTRRLHDMHRASRKRWCDAKEASIDNKEAFVSMQEWFDGLHLRSSTREIAEKIFLLRSYHRSDHERNIYEKKTVLHSMSCLNNCLEEISQMKINFQKWKNKPKPSNFSLCFNTATKSQETKTLLQQAAEEQETEQELDNIDEQNITLKQGEFHNRCSTCHKYLCQCEKDISNMHAVLKHKSDEATNANGGLNGVNNEKSHRKSSKTVSETFPENLHPRNRHIVTLKLREAELQEAANSRDSNEQITEKEVQKALQRVPYITNLNKLKKNGDNTWTITAESSQKHVTNVRFNCKKKSFIIGLF